MNLPHILVLSVVLETHSEIGSLTEDFNLLKTYYQSEKDYDIEIKNALETNELVSKNTDIIDHNEEIQYFDNQVLTSQIKKFQQIFLQNTIKDNNKEQKVNEN
ncbi:7108_t:CDS:1 [Dentiscutata erythropus]|uniref:7108_t:CDS:1 n=1 Tax=Dentiscutata erythropus TaxID=1348616 RepID=A0A9N9BY20_9GLOM|nr:7108_t:CDS:1 [Dentiscutata erythropus]